MLQASYLKVLDGRARFAGESRFSTWLFGVIRMTAREQARRHWVRGLALVRRKAELEPPAAREPGERADYDRLRLELGRLPERQREVLHLVFYSEHSISEAAEVMRVSLGSARTHYERGKRSLRKRLGLENER